MSWNPRLVWGGLAGATFVDNRENEAAAVQFNRTAEADRRNHGS